MKNIKILITLALIVSILGACSKESTSTQNTSKEEPTSPIAVCTATPESDSTAIGSTATPDSDLTVTPVTTESNNALTLNETGRTVIRKVSTDEKNDISSVIVSKDGTVIACDPMNLPEGIEPDIILVTHNHHQNPRFYKEHPDAKILNIEAGTIEAVGVKVTGIAASHNTANIYVESPSFVIYLIEVDDLRIVYMACLGQTKLSDDQMEALGEIDIAMITTDEYSGYISVNKAIDLMKQLNPKVIVPLNHHYYDFEKSMEKLEEEFGEIYTAEGELAVDPASLKDYAEYKTVNITKPE